MLFLRLVACGHVLPVRTMASAWLASTQAVIVTELPSWRRFLARESRVTWTFYRPAVSIRNVAILSSCCYLNAATQDMSPGSIIWYRPMGGDAFQLGM